MHAPARPLGKRSHSFHVIIDSGVAGKTLCVKISQKSTALGEPRSSAMAEGPLRIKERISAKKRENSVTYHDFYYTTSDAILMATKTISEIPPQSFFLKLNNMNNHSFNYGPFPKRHCINNLYLFQSGKIHFIRS